MALLRSHGENASRRRRALLESARALAAESGAGAVTHRAVSRRAGLPPTTTTYFFSSIDELVDEALQTFVDETVADLEALTIAWAKRDADVHDLVASIAAFLTATPTEHGQAQVEVYLGASRRPELRAAVARMLVAFEDVALVALRAASVTDPERRARAVVALTDGFLLHHLAKPRPDDEEQLRAALLDLLDPAIART